MTKNKPILIVGAGSIGRRHLRNLKSIGWNNLVVLRRKADPEFEKEHGVRVITDYAQLLETPYAVMACNPTSMHLGPLRYAVESDAHLFMEKPLIHTEEGLQEAEKLLNGYNKCFFIGFMLRYHPAIRKIKEILDSGEYGKAYSARLEFGSYLPNWPYEDYRKSYAARKELGGGVINTISHELDLIQYFFGTPDSLKSTSFNFGKLGIEVEEMCEAVFRYPDTGVSLHLDYLQKEYDRRLRILFDDGVLEWSWVEEQIRIKPVGKDAMILKIPMGDVNNLYIDEIKHFLELAENSKQEHPLNADHALRNTRLLLDMHKESDLRSQISD